MGNEAENFSLFDALPSEWKGDGARPIMLRFYGSSIPRHPDGSEILRLIREIADKLTPTAFKLLCLDIRDAEVFTVSKPAITYGPSGRKVYIKGGEERIPSGDYLCIAAPMNTEAAARETISILRGIAVTCFGQTAADSAVYSLQMNQNGTISQTSDTIENHFHISRFRFLPAAMTRALFERSKLMNQDVARRLAIAMTFVDRTAGEIDPIVRFSNLWIAFEICSNGKPDRVLKRLNGKQQLCGILRELDQARNQLFHSGIHPDFSQDAERVLMLAILVEPLLAVGVTDRALQELYEHLQAENGRPGDSFTDVAIR